jgi:hypothetical protein
LIPSNRITFYSGIVRSLAPIRAYLQLKCAPTTSQRVERILLLLRDHRKTIEKWFKDLPPTRVAIEAGVNSIWMSGHLQERTSASRDPTPEENALSRCTHRWISETQWPRAGN